MDRVRVDAPELVSYGCTSALLQLFCGLHGKRHREKAECVASTTFQDADDTLDKNLRLATASRRDDEHLTSGRGDGALLVRCE